MSQKFNYPSFPLAYPRLYQKGLFRRLPKQLRYYVVSVWYKSQIQSLVSQVNNSKNLSTLLKTYPKIAQPIFEGYIANGYSIKQRIAMIIKDLHIAEQILPDTFFEDKSITLIQLQDDLSIRLQLNPLSCVEGIWLMGLYHHEKRVYVFTFTLGEDEKLIIGSIQGASADQNKTLIKTTTKKMHGLRPQQLMIWLAMTLANILNIQSVEAISDDNHPRMNIRKKLRGKTIFDASYNDIWQAYGGKVQDNGNWKLAPIVTKSIEEYPSKKRSMYRKRYAMLQEIESKFNELFM